MTGREGSFLSTVLFWACSGRYSCMLGGRKCDRGWSAPLVKLESQNSGGGIVKLIESDL